MALPDQEILDRFENVRSKGTGNRGQRMFDAFCPAHDTHHHSLSIWKHADGGWHVHCYAGCEQEEILAAVGLRVADLCPDDERPDGGYVDPRKLERSRLILAMAEHDRASGKKLSPRNKQEERQAWLLLKKSS